MKKKIIVAVLIVIILALIPIPRTYKGAESDEGTKYYQALTYKIVKWNRKFYKDLVFTKTEFYRFPFNFYSIDELWNGMCIDPAIEAEDETQTTLTPSAKASSETEAKENAQPEAVSDEKQSPEAETDISSTTKLPEETTKVKNSKTNEGTLPPVSDPKKNNDVILSSLNGDFENVHLDPESSAKIFSIIKNNKFNTPSFDNISDYKLIVNGVVLYYDTNGGIVTAGAIKSENDNSKNAVKLREKDKNTLNSIIAECERAYKLIYG